MGRCCRKSRPREPLCGTLLDVRKVSGANGSGLALSVGVGVNADATKLMRRNSRAGGQWRRSDEAERQRLEVLNDGGEMELVTRA